MLRMRLFWGVFTASVLLCESCSSSPKPSAVNQSNPQLAQQLEAQSQTETLTPPEVVRSEEVRVLKDVKMLIVGNANGHYFLSCNKTLDSCITPVPGTNYMVFTKTTRWKFPGAKDFVTLQWLQSWSGTYTKDENIALVPVDGDRTAIGMYWLRSWEKKD